jgi:hypothetical protein
VIVGPLRRELCVGLRRLRMFAIVHHARGLILQVGLVLLRPDQAAGCGEEA